MQIAPEQGQFMALLVELMGARRAIEVGVFTGYSSLSVASVLPPDGTLLACDINPAYTAIAQPFWEEAGVEDRIDLRIGPASRTLDTVLKEEGDGGWDFMFIDADKEGYDAYYERALELIRNGGLIALDNTLWEGKVVDPATTDVDTEAIRAINMKLADDERVTLSLVPVGDGLTLARKR